MAGRVALVRGRCGKILSDGIDEQPGDIGTHFLHVIFAVENNPGDDNMIDAAEQQVADSDPI